MKNGKEWWINGINTPWQCWNDFCGDMDTAFWEETFAQLKADRINATRIWINCDGEKIVRLQPNGEVESVNEAHWQDLDTLFALAEKYDIYIMATLLSFDHFKEPNTGYEKWRSMLSNPAAVDSFTTQYVVPFCERYGGCEYLFSIDLMNEPDWVYENKECGLIDWERLSYFFGRCAQAIHETCETLVTVGIGVIKYNSTKYVGNMVSDEYLQKLTGSQNAYLDFYSPHFYMWQAEGFGFPCNLSPQEFGLDGTKPVIIGETSTDDEDECGMSLPDKYRSVYDNGWNGLMVWIQTIDCDKTWHGYPATAEATRQMAEYISDKI